MDTPYSNIPTYTDYRCHAPQPERMLQAQTFDALRPFDVSLPPKRKFFFGFYIESEVLVAYARQFVPDELYSLWEGNLSSLWLLGMEMLAQEAGLRSDLQAELVIVDEDVRWECSCVKEGEGTICAVIPLCENAKYSLARRPTQAQVDLLSDILGQKPRWWLSAGYE